MGVGLSHQNHLKNPVVVRLDGGLGNQMFQYAAGLDLAKRLGTTLYLDPRQYETYTLHGFALSDWNISATIAPSQILNQVRPLRIRLGQKMPFLLGRSRFFKESSLAFDPAWHGIQHGKWLLGYFQSEQYFSAARARLLQEFTLRKPLGTHAEQCSNAIQNSNAVAVHVRRGDYISNPVTLQIHGVCSPAYYQQAIQSITQRVEQARFFVFSNDPQWAQANIAWPVGTCFVNSGESSPAVDLALMAMCQHHIIANSSYSWWGAWLSLFDQGIKIAPQPWFDDPTYPEQTLVPAHWERIQK